MFKKLFILFILLSVFSFSNNLRVVNQCKILEKPERNLLVCKDLKLKDTFNFITDDVELWKSFKIGKVYKIKFDYDSFDYDGKTLYEVREWQLMK